MEMGEEETPARSLFEIGDLATAKIKAEQKKNAQKSVAKIKEITKKHVQKKKDEPEAGSEDDVEMGSIDFQEEETKKEDKAGGDKKKKKPFVNKNTVGTDKLTNKRK